MSAAVTQRRFPPPWSVEERPGLLHRQRCERASARLRVLRGGAGPTNGRQAHDPGRGAAHRGEYRQAAGAVEAGARLEPRAAGTQLRREPHGGDANCFSRLSNEVPRRFARIDCQ